MSTRRKKLREDHRLEVPDWREAEEEATPEPAVPTPPAHWRKGQLLDLKRYSDGSYVCLPLGEPLEPDLSNALKFDSGYAAQQFTSQWYQRETQNR